MFTDNLIKIAIQYKQKSKDFAKWLNIVIQTKNFRDFVPTQGKSNFDNFRENEKLRPISYLC